MAKEPELSPEDKARRAELWEQRNALNRQLFDHLVRIVIDADAGTSEAETLANVANGVALYRAERQASCDLVDFACAARERATEKAKQSQLMKPTRTEVVSRIEKRFEKTKAKNKQSDTQTRKDPK